MREEMKAVIRSPMFYLSFTVLFVSLLGYSFPNWFLIDEPILAWRESAFTLSIGGVFFGGLMLLLPFCAAVSHTVRQVDEIHSSVLGWRVLRSSTRTYARIKIASGMLSAAASTGLAFLLHAVLWNIIALPVDPLTYPGHEVGFDPSCLYFNWYTIAYGLPVYLSMTVGIAFTASIWSVVALATAVWIPDRLLVVTIPSCIYYLWNCQLPYYLFGVFLPDPSTLFNDMLTPRSAMECILMYLILLVVSVFVYYAGLERRARNA